MNKLLLLIGGPSAGAHPCISYDELIQVLEQEWECRWGLKGAKYRPEGFSPIPRPAEERMSFPEGKLRAAGDSCLSKFPAEGHRAFLVAFHRLLISYHYSDTFPVVFNMVGRSYVPSHEAQKQTSQQQSVNNDHTGSFDQHRSRQM